MASGGSLPTFVGSYVATGAGLSVEVGYTPKSVKFVNIDTGATAEWFDTMDDATVVTHDSGTDAIDAVQGVTPADTGFSIGTNAVINTDTEVIHVTATG